MDATTFRDGRAVLIAIEGRIYFDIEWEHVFRCRFGERYPVLSPPGLYPQRLGLDTLGRRPVATA